MGKGSNMKLCTANKSVEENSAQRKLGATLKNNEKNRCSGKLRAVVNNNIKLWHNNK
jgi:hypothetical protein